MSGAGAAPGGEATGPSANGAPHRTPSARPPRSTSGSFAASIGPRMLAARSRTASTPPAPPSANAGPGLSWGKGHHVLKPFSATMPARSCRCIFGYAPSARKLRSISRTMVDLCRSRTGAISLSGTLACRQFSILRRYCSDSCMQTVPMLALPIVFQQESHFEAARTPGEFQLGCDTGSVSDQPGPFFAESFGRCPGAGSGAHGGSGSRSGPSATAPAGRRNSSRCPCRCRVRVRRRTRLHGRR